MHKSVSPTLPTLISMELSRNHLALFFIYLQVTALIKELAGAASAAKGITFDVGIEDRLCAYARSVAHFPTALKEV